MYLKASAVYIVKNIANVFLQINDCKGSEMSLKKKQSA